MTTLRFNPIPLVALVLVATCLPAEAQDGYDARSTLAFCTGQPDGTACDDGNACTAGESCQAGTCVPPVTLAPGAGSPIGVGTGPRSVGIGDWTGDGVLDLAVANRTGNDVTILKGNGSGGFATLGPTVGVGSGPIAIAVGDWNGNGVRDLAVANSTSNSVSILLGDGAGGFTAAGPAVSVGNVPVSVATGDWNGDGKADLAVANQNAGNVTILLGNGSGGFATAPIPTVTAGAFPVSVVAGDWNGDGTLDLAVANQNSTNVSILLGVGNGEFGDAPGSPVPVAGGPFSITALDSRASGILDLAVVSITGNTVTVLLGNGTGGFSAGAPIAVGTSPRSVTARDLNRDGRLDLAVANFGTNNVTILLGNGSGGFAAIGTFSLATGTGPSAVVSGDMNGDGKQDLAVVNTNSNNVTILMNTTTHATNGLGCNDNNTCTTADVCQLGVCAGTSVANGTACDDGNPCTVFESCRAGVCAPPVSFGQPAGSPVATGGDGPRAIVTGDWNGDSILDLAIANRTGGSVTSLLGNGMGGFTPRSLFSSSLGPIAIAVGDWDGNGTRDLAVANSNAGANNVTVLLGDGTGGYSPAAGSPVAAGTVPVAVATGDLNGDGNLDLAVANQNSNDVTILLGDGAGGFTPSAGSPVTVGTTPVAVVVGDFNRDAKLDLAVANQTANNLTVLLGNGSGGFTPATGSPVSAGTGPFAIAVGDLNRDGRADLAVANNTSNDVTVLLSSGAGTFSPAAGSPMAVGTGPRSVVARDLNRDGRLDLAVANFGSNNVAVLLGNGAGGFGSAAPVAVAPGTGPSSVAGGDLDVDGKQDLVVANTNTHNFTILLSNTAVAGNGTACNDLNPCTQTDTCQSGVCTGSNPFFCAPSDGCHSGQCSVATGTCSNPRRPNGTGCSDGNACTNGDTCGGGTCSPGTPVVCDDGNVCNGVETCSPATGCVAGAPVNCSDGLFCTIDSCDPPTGDCGHTPTPCGDNLVCTVDACDEGANTCVHTNTCIQVCNTGAITINDRTTATPYPSSISISGAFGTFSLGSVDLIGIEHTFPNDIDILLVAPTAATDAIVMSDAGGGDDVVGVNLTLADGASPLPIGPPLVSGTFAPTNFSTGDAWPAPAPAPVGGSALSVFDGTNPNGSWSLFVVDDATGDTGSITGGWCLNYRLTCNTAANCDDGDPCTTDGCTNSACTHTTIGTPELVTSVAASADKQTYTWTARPNSTRYDAVRGALNALPVGPGGGDEVCFDNLPGSVLVDPAAPAPGGPGFWYLFRGENACTNGSFGTQSNLTPRVTTTCP